MGSMSVVLDELAETLHAVRVAKSDEKIMGVAEREFRMAGNRFEARQAIGAQWTARDRIEELRLRLPGRLAASLFR